MNTKLLMQAIDLAIQGKWDQSHQIVQDLDSDYAAWIHAVLHKIEGDRSNAKYWYARAGKSYDSSPAEQELKLIKLELANKT